MKKFRFNGEIAFFIALNILAIGMVFIFKADFGITVIQSPVFVLGKAIPKISVGVWTYLIQSILFIIMILIIKKFKITFILSFLSAFIYGLLLNFYIKVLNLPIDILYLRVIYFICGYLLCVISVSIFFTCKAPLMPYDIFLREVCVAKKYSIPKMKWIYDFSFLSISIILSLILTKKIICIGFGTIILTLLITPGLHFTKKFIDKHFNFYSIFEKEKDSQ